MSVEPIVHPDGTSPAFGTASQAATWQLAAAGRRIAAADNPTATRAMTSAAMATIEMGRRGRASPASEVEGCSIPNIIPDPPECGLKREDSLPPEPGRPGLELSLIHISEPTRLGMISYAVFCF